MKFFLLTVLVFLFSCSSFQQGGKSTYSDGKNVLGIQQSDNPKEISEQIYENVKIYPVPVAGNVEAEIPQPVQETTRISTKLGASQDLSEIIKQNADIGKICFVAFVMFGAGYVFFKKFEHHWIGILFVVGGFGVIFFPSYYIFVFLATVIMAIICFMVYAKTQLLMSKVIL